MSSSATSNNNMFCICFKDPTSARKLYVNFISDGREASSIKVPKSMLLLAQPGDIQIRIIAGLIPAEKQELIKSITSSLKGWYGNRMPRMYVDEDDDKDLVMNVHIYKDHAKALKQLDDNEASKITFLKLILTTIQTRVCELVKDPGLSTKTVSPQIARIRAASRPTTGRVATKDEICANLLVPKVASGGDTRRAPQTERTSFRVGECLFHLCQKDYTLNRAVYYNLVLSNHPAAIRLPKLMLDIAQKSRLEALKMADSADVQNAERSIEIPIRKCLYNYNNQQGPDVFVAQSNPKDLVINVPFALEHAPLWQKCFIGTYIRSFVSATIHDFYLFRFLGRSRAKGWQTNERFDPILDTEYQAPGRRATDDEIYSLMLRETGSQSWQTHLFGEWYGGISNDDDDDY